MDLDSTMMTFTEDVFENVTRQPGSLWANGEVVWSNVVGEEASPKDEIYCPLGWKWTDSWQIDLSRAVDEVGFEYCVDSSVGGFVPVEKTYHLYRRRRWVRNRERLPNVEQIAVQVLPLTSLARPPCPPREDLDKSTPNTFTDMPLSAKAEGGGEGGMGVCSSFHNQVSRETTQDPHGAATAVAPEDDNH